MNKIRDRWAHDVAHRSPMTHGELFAITGVGLLALFGHAVMVLNIEHFFAEPVGVALFVIGTIGLNLIAFISGATIAYDLAIADARRRLAEQNGKEDR